MADNIAEDFEKSLETEVRSPAFKGTSRVFFIALAIAVLMQALSIVQMQVKGAENILSADFKILVTVDGKVNSSLINEMGSALSSANGVTALKFISSQDAFELLKGAKPQIAEKFVFLNKNPMPEYFEIKLNAESLANIDGWLKENITGPYPQASVHYKAEAAKLIAYMAALGYFLNFLSVIVVVLLVAFIFFVEAYCVKGDCPRSGGIVVSVIAYGLSLLIIYATSAPLVVLGGKYWLFTTPLRQGIMFVTVSLLGWTMAKWKRF